MATRKHCFKKLIIVIRLDGRCISEQIIGSFFHLKSYKTKSVMKMAKPKIKRKKGKKKYGGRICIHLEDNKRRWTKDGDEDTKKLSKNHQ